MSNISFLIFFFRVWVDGRLWVVHLIIPWNKLYQKVFFVYHSHTTFVGSQVVAFLNYRSIVDKWPENCIFITISLRLPNFDQGRKARKKQKKTVLYFNNHDVRLGHRLDSFSKSGKITNFRNFNFAEISRIFEMQHN